MKQSTVTEFAATLFLSIILYSAVHASEFLAISENMQQNRAVASMQKVEDTTVMELKTIETPTSKPKAPVTQRPRTGKKRRQSPRAGKKPQRKRLRSAANLASPQKKYYYPLWESQYQDIWDAIQQDKALKRDAALEAIDPTSLFQSFENGSVVLKCSDIDTPELREELRRDSGWWKVELSNRTSSLNGILDLKNNLFLCAFSNEVLGRIFGGEVTKRFKKDVCALVIPHMEGNVAQKLQCIKLPETVNTVIFSLSADIGALDLSKLTDTKFELEISDFSPLLSYDLKRFPEVSPAKRWKATIPSFTPYGQNKQMSDQAIASAMLWHKALSKMSPYELDAYRQRLRKTTKRVRYW
ncbi:MAG: hypothetical protein K6C34_02180 [Alphaproteobacteria bacterium]|nr:hypothetical protein [Alphaproteobacteria bacterium]